LKDTENRKGVKSSIFYQAATGKNAARSTESPSSSIIQRALKFWRYLMARSKISLFKDSSAAGDIKKTKFKKIFKDTKLTAEKSCKKCDLKVEEHIIFCPVCSNEDRTVFLTSQIFYRRQGQKTYFKGETDEVKLSSRAIDYFNRGEVGTVLTLRKRISLTKERDFLKLMSESMFDSAG